LQHTATPRVVAFYAACQCVTEPLPAGCTATHCNTLLHIATISNTLQHNESWHSSHCTTLQHTATHCNTRRHTTTHCNTLQQSLRIVATSQLLQHNTTHCDTLQLTATLRHTAIHCKTRRHIATHCNTLQHIATHCNTLQHTATLCNRVCELLPPHSNCNTLRHPATHSATHCNTYLTTGLHGALLWKLTCNLRHHMSLRHPVVYIDTYPYMMNAMTHCVAVCCLNFYGLFSAKEPYN